MPAEAGVCTATVSYVAASATDNCAVSEQWSVGPASGSTFAVGATPVTFYANDTTDNVAHCVYIATVTDTQTPTISKLNVMN